MYIVKEICEKADVNRSTFYLHYETVGDLLDECVEYANRKCFERFGNKHKKVGSIIDSEDLDSLIFITPEYLKPYFEFVRENKRLFKIALLHPSALRAEKTFASLFRDVFSPILDRFHFADESKLYVISFYVSGLIAVVSEWIKRDCSDSMDKMIEVCMQCVIPGGKGILASRLENGCVK